MPHEWVFFLFISKLSKKWKTPLFGWASRNLYKSISIRNIFRNTWNWILVNNKLNWLLVTVIRNNVTFQYKRLFPNNYLESIHKKWLHNCLLEERNKMCVKLLQYKWLSKPKSPWQSGNIKSLIVQNDKIVGHLMKRTRKMNMLG